jgi:outer membrane receptor protein involved in Fe transport
MSLVTDWNFFWRQSTKDGVYNPGGQLLRSGAGSSARFVGHSPSIALEWRATQRLTFTGIYSHFFPGPFIEDTGPSEDIDFIELTLKVQF